MSSVDAAKLHVDELKLGIVKLLGFLSVTSCVDVLYGAVDSNVTCIGDAMQWYVIGDVM
ncbi:MAG: hypothetical protein ACREHV_05560 [Rhizomicrobium sp.]